MKDMDVRWKQRFQNFENAYKYLSEMTLIEEYSEIHIDATIQRFEIAYELAWKTLQDFLEAQGYSEYKGPKLVIGQAFHIGVLADSGTWLRMIEDRNILAHAYDYDKSREIFRNIISRYISAFTEFYEKMNHERNK